MSAGSMRIMVTVISALNVFSLRVWHGTRVKVPTSHAHGEGKVVSHVAVKEVDKVKVEREDQKEKEKEKAKGKAVIVAVKEGKVRAVMIVFGVSAGNG